MKAMPQGTCPKALPCLSATYERTHVLTKTLSHLDIESLRLGTRTRAYGFRRGFGNRTGFALCSEAAP